MSRPQVPACGHGWHWGYPCDDPDTATPEYREWLRALTPPEKDPPMRDPVTGEPRAEEMRQAISEINRRAAAGDSAAEFVLTLVKAFHDQQTAVARVVAEARNAVRVLTEACVYLGTPERDRDRVDFILRDCQIAKGRLEAVLDPPSSPQEREANK